MPVDERDLELLSILEQDARKPWRRIARQMGVSEATVYLRVKKLEDEGVLRGYTIRVDPKSLGLDAILIILLRVEAKAINTIRDLLPRMRYVAEAYEITGHYHFLAKIMAPTYEEATKVVDELIEADGIVEVTSFTVMRTLKGPGSIVRDYMEWRSKTS